MTATHPSGTEGVAALPKAELHCHLGGVLDPEMARDLGEAGHDLGIDGADFEACYPVCSMTDFIDVYLAFIDRFLRPRDVRLLPLLIQQVRRWNRQNLTYAELFVSDILLSRDDLGELITLYQLYRDTARAEADDGLQVALVACIGRGPLDRMTRQTERIIALYEAGVICGISIAGLEELPLKPAEPLFRRLRDTGMGIEIHAGETSGPESVWDALTYGVPHRLGHGLAAFEDERLIEKVTATETHLEFCPTSNLQLGCIKSIEAHPLLAAKRHGLRFSVNTDDPGAFRCSMTSELELVERQFGLSRADLLGIHADTVAAGFLRRGR
jgi:aminodeoxyfutalosine deaminase